MQLASNRAAAFFFAACNFVFLNAVEEDSALGNSSLEQHRDSSQVSLPSMQQKSRVTFTGIVWDSFMVLGQSRRELAWYLNVAFRKFKFQILITTERGLLDYFSVRYGCTRLVTQRLLNSSLQVSAAQILSAKSNH